MSKILMKGNEALALAAIKGGCTHFFGYPITPQNEIPEFLARELPKSGGVFLQAESELAAIHMVYGASAAGARVMTSSSSPGIALMQEGMSVLSAAELPCVVVNVQRAGPGIGGIQPSQADYYQMTRGGGNGDYRILCFAPATIQESVELMQEAFELADYYRSPVYILSDGMLGQMMEPVTFKKVRKRKLPDKKWAVTGHGGKRSSNIIKTMALDPERLEETNRRVQKKYDRIERSEPRYERDRTENAEIILVAYGSAARIVKNSIDLLNSSEIRAGLIRPITLWPFPHNAFAELPATCTKIMCVEMSCGQMVDDVRLAVAGRVPVTFYGRSGGMIPAPAEIAEKVREELRRT
ncbi:MAG: 3-methyl-2-oxobutanoate dehydrogenase subunit VorB [Deltaproteobacteria bacterium]|nr:3-methyl-2-oxobutanoate dehydrogenase subunit VorB [Deltaproteobacteria bacterium]